MLSQLKLSPLQRLLFLFFFGRVSTTLLDVLTQLITVSAQYVQASPFRPAPTKQKTTRSDIKPHNKATFSNGDEVCFNVWSSQFSTFSESRSLSQIFYTFKKKNFTSQKKKKKSIVQKQGTLTVTQSHTQVSWSSYLLLHEP